MKKYKNKLLSIIPVAASAAIGPAGAFATQDQDNIENDINNENVNQNTFVNKMGSISRISNMDQKIIFDGIEYANIDEATKAFLSKPGAVTTKTYLGDIDNATVSNEYNTVDVSKLKDPQSGTSKKAYKTLGGIYTDDYDQAKRSYLQNPKIQWSDGNGNLYDSELEAKNAIFVNGGSLTNKVSYYTITDHSRKDMYGRSTKVNINPLNSQDSQTLKEIATRNVTLGNSDFSLGRYDYNMYDGSTYYQYNDLRGWTNDQVDGVVNSVATEIASIVSQNMWFNTKVSAHAEKHQMRLSYYSPKGGRWGRPTYFSDLAQFDYTVAGHDNTKGTFYSNIMSDASSLTSYANFKTKFNVQYNDFGNRSHVKPTARAISSSGIFGGQQLDISLVNDSFISNKYAYFYDKSVSITQSSLKNNMLCDNDIGFLGDGHKNNAYFSLSFSQSGINEAMQKNPSLRNELNNRAQSVKNGINSLMTKKLAEWGITGSTAQQIATTIGNEASKLLFTDVLGNGSYTTPTLSSTSQVQDTFRKIQQTIVSVLDNAMRSSNNMGLKDVLRRCVANEYQSRDQRTSNQNVIYTIDYNGLPLFKIDSSVYVTVVNDPMYASKPLETMKKYLNENLSRNYNDFFDKFVSGLTNISNKFVLDQNGNIKLHKDAISNYNNSTTNNIKFDANTDHGTSGVDPSINLFDESIFVEKGISTSELQKQLNRREDDNVANLNNQHGTYASIYEYNKDLKRVLTSSNNSTALLKNVKKNALTNPNDVVVLYDKDKTTATTRYGEYLNYGNLFNESLSSGNVRILNSIEKRNSEVNIEGMMNPTKVYTFYGYNGEVVSSEYINPINGSYELGEKQAYENALKKVQLPPSDNLVYFIDNKTQTKELVSNTYIQLQVLTVTSNGKQYQYGFNSYDDLFRYASDYIVLYGNSDTPPPLFPPTDNTDPSGSLNAARTQAALSGIYATIVSICVIEVVFLSFIFVAKHRKNKQFLVGQNTSYYSNVNSTPNKNTNTSTNNKNQTTSIKPNVKFKF